MSESSATGDTADVMQLDRYAIVSKEIAETVLRAAERLASSTDVIFVRLKKLAEEIAQLCDELPHHIHNALILLGQHGWYVDPEMSLDELPLLMGALTDGDIKKGDRMLMAYFANRIDQIENSIVAKFPHRLGPITAAFEAHRRREFYLSIPVLLAQADGVCKEITGEHLFRKHGKKPQTSRYVAQVQADPFDAALLGPLAEALPIGASERERAAEFCGLNRHTVLHGESLDYGTEVNSLKAISLMNYVAWVLKERETRTIPRDPDSKVLDVDTVDSDTD